MDRHDFVRGCPPCTVGAVGTTDAEPAWERYLVDVMPPSGELLDVQALASRIRASCTQLSSEGMPVRFLRSVFVPEDGSCLLVFEAASAEDVRLASERADLPPSRISRAIAQVRREPAPRDGTQT